MAGAILALAAGAAQAQQTPTDRAREAAAMITAATFQIRGNQIVNACGRPSQPRPTAIDLNGDGKPEAVITDVDAACYGGGPGEQFWLIQRMGPASWSLVGAGVGRFKVLPTRTNGWLDYTLEGSGCQRVWNYNPGVGYISPKACPGEGARPAAGPAPAPKAAPSNPADREAAFRAAGFPAVRGKHPACDKAQEAEIEIRDLNGDGRPDALVIDHGSFCYGQDEQGFVIVTKDAAGAWRKLYANSGVATFQTTRGAGGWPDIENGGPGFCFPILRWNGSDYAIVRWKPYQPGACAGRR